MNVVLKSLGCRLNEAELQGWARQFQSRGYIISNDPETADLVVLNTCAVTQEAVKKSRQLIRRTQRKNPKAKLIVSGCYASLDENSTDQIEGIDLLIPNRKKDQLVDIASQELQLPTMPSLATSVGETALFARNRSRAFIKVQDGCRYRCAFCIVTVARGEEKSRNIAEIIDDINAVHSEGVQEVVLTGVHIGGFGSDINRSLLELIQTILTDTDIPHLRLGSVEPWDLPDDFFNLFDNPRFMPHLHLPLQSGSNSVLKRMARRCKTQDFKRLVEQARTQVRDFNVTTDIIVGFPGETESEWQVSMDFIESIGFAHVHIFSYSKRAGTKAAGMENQVPNQEKARRSQALHQLAKKMKTDAYREYLGRELPVLWEGSAVQDADGRYYYGYTPNYLRVKTRIDEDTDLANTITQAGLESISDCGQTIDCKIVTTSH